MKELKFMRFAEAAASLSKDSTKVGAVAINDEGIILSVGYNGPPRGVQDLPERLLRPTKYFFASHAESNLVAQAAYAGHSLKGSTVLVHGLYPCSHCCKMLIQSGVRRIFCPPPEVEGKWAEEAAYSSVMFKEARLEVIHVE